MAANFRTRPWLLAPVRSTSMSIHLVGGASRALAPAMEQTRSYAKKADSVSRSQLGQMKKETRGQKATQSMMNEMVAQTIMANPSELATVAPLTIVPMSFFKGFTTLWRDSPKKFFYYYWAVLKQRIVDRIAMFQMSVQLRGGITKKFRRPDFKPTRKGVVEEALKLHAIMSHSVANGGKAERVQLAKICTPKLYRSLLAVIEARPAGKTYRWERVKLLRRLPFFPSWTRKPFWPRVVDFKWTEMPLGAGIDIKFRQAVVGIKSRQRLTQLNERGKPVGAPKEMELTEYLVLWRQVQNETQTLGPWLLSGTVQETGYEELKSEQDQIKLLSQLVTEQNLEENKKVAEAKGQKRTAGAS